ncbi:folate-binding protein YgfZ [Labrenzia sp. 011]|uniref:CAF17-like 4Fe-4S cluster assembly/insertion protein YgfZ n=1 Tax=Labrenzia sp. 011 TaxID=2171494 RepID=UPI000D50B513|nr:folate-binding protein YgfZ [Labrenzia sp. 011]PVB63216.1 folate-binding protein [Labrenzia sp. 011]
MPVSSPAFTLLTDRALIRLSGSDTHHFLQNLVTADMEAVDRTGAGSAALLTPQGKIQFDFLIYKAADAYLLDVPAAAAADLLKRLTFYRLRAKVELEPLSAETGVFALGEGGSEMPDALLTVTDPRLPALGRRSVAAASADLPAAQEGLAAYDAHRISLGVPEGLKDYAYSDIFPHDADLDQLNGVSFRKGCFVGQEVVSRVQHRGTARKRFLPVESDGALPPMGASVTAGGKSVGTLGSSAKVEGKTIALALLRLDKVAQAKENDIPLQCGDAVLQASLPDWATFDWPEPTTAD